MEPAHTLLVQRLGKDPYKNTRVPDGPIVSFDEDNLEYNLDHRTINVRNALTINDFNAFYYKIIVYLYLIIGKKFIVIKLP